MIKPQISLIAALDSKRGIGRDNALIFHAPSDMKRFRDLTRGHVIIMGRKQFESKEQGAKPLPHKVNIIVTRDTSYNGNGAIVVHSFEQAIEKAKQLEKEEIFVIGGGQIFNEAISVADKLYLTLVDADLHAQVFFPDYSSFNNIVAKEELDENGFHFTFLDLQRNKNIKNAH